MKTSKKFLFFLPVVAGMLLFITIIKNKQGPVRPDMAEVSRRVNVVKIQSMTIRPSVTGYGYVQPTETWDAIPEVSGRIVEIHPELKKGSFVKKGDLLVKIDTQTYGLAESRGEASVMSIEAQLKELEQERRNTQKLLTLERKSLQLTQQELERKRKLFTKGYISASDLEQEEKNLLAQQSNVDNLSNTLKLIPSQEKALIAQKQSDLSSLSESRLNIAKTVIRAPFDCRIAAVAIELDQYAPAGTTLLTAVNISAVEIPVQVSPGSFISLLSTPEGSKSPLFTTNLDMDMVRELIGISAKVRLPLFDRQAEWDGVFRRTGDAMDLATGAIPVYIAVDNPYADVIPGVRPPLIPNMYTEVELYGRLKKNRLVIPFAAIHGGAVWTVDSTSRLAKQKVDIEMVIGNMAVIAENTEDTEGLTPGTMVLTTDLVPAIEGMLLSPMIDEQQMAQINSLRVD